MLYTPGRISKAATVAAAASSTSINEDTPGPKECFTGVLSEPSLSISSSRESLMHAGLSRRPRLKIFGKPLFNNFQDLPKSTENNVQTHDWRGFFANVPTENG